MPPSGHVHKAIFHQPPGQPVPHSKPRPAHQTQSTLNRPPPMTNFYDSPRAENHGPPSPLRRGDFPPPPPFISQIKQLTTQVYEQGSQSRGIGFDLPPPPPELMVQAARSSKVRLCYVSFFIACSGERKCDSSNSPSRCSSSSTGKLIGRNICSSFHFRGGIPTLDLTTDDALNTRHMFSQCSFQLCFKILQRLFFSNNCFAFFLSPSDAIGWSRPT